MQIAVIVEQVGAEYRARCRHPVAAEAAGQSRYEATAALEAVLRQRVAGPFELLPLEASPDRPWVSFAGSIPDDALTEEWLDAIAEQRRERDAADRSALPPSPTTRPTP
jgi:hypothetical protein